MIPSCNESTVVAPSALRNISIVRACLTTDALLASLAWLLVILVSPLMRMEGGSTCRFDSY